MKNILFRILKLVLAPVVYCWQIIQDAPIVCCDDALIGFGECRRYLTPEHPRPARRKEKRGTGVLAYGKAGM